MFQGMGGGMSSLQLSARDVMSTGAGDVAGSIDKSFDPGASGAFYGGSINTGIVDTNLLIIIGIAFVGLILLKKVK